MPTKTIYTNTGPRWGSSGYTSSTDYLKVGKSGNGTYYGRIGFPALNKSWYIKSIKLRMRRVDEYSAKTLKCGSHDDGDWDVKYNTNFVKTLSVSSGTSTKEWDLTAYKGIIQSYGGTWYLHIRHGSGDNSYCEFAGGYSGNAPRLVVEYEEASLEVPGGEFTIEQLKQITIGTAGSGLVHKLSYAVGDSVGVLNGGAPINAGDVIEWTPPASLAYEITDGMVGVVTLTLESYQNGELLSTLALPYPLNVPASYVPTINNAVFALSNPAGDDIGIYVQGRSRTNCTVSVTPKAGAPIVEYRLSIDGRTYTVQSADPSVKSVSILTDVLSSAGSLPAVVEVVDSRGQMARLERTAAVMVNAYFPPMVTGFAVARANQNGVPTNDGQYIKVTLACVFAPLANKNTRGGALRYKGSGDASFSAPISLDSTMAGAGENVYVFTLSCLIGGGQIGPGAYIVAATLFDRYSASAEALVELPSKQIYFELHSSGEGMAVGGEAVTPSLFDVYLPSRFRGLVQFDNPGAVRAALGVTLGNLGVQTGKSGSISVSANSVKDTSISFPVPFASTPIVIACSEDNSGWGNANATTSAVRNITPGGFTFRILNAHSATRTAICHWIAIGEISS